MDNSILNSLLDGSNDGKSSSFTPAINLNLDYLKPYLIVLMILSIVITVLFIVNAINHWRVNRAIIDMHKILREINERQKPTHANISKASEENYTVVSSSDSSADANAAATAGRAKS